jgi:hypothetical protein
MYYDDPYDPTLENDYDVPESVQSDSITVDSRTKKFKKLMEDVKNEDKGYCKIKRNFVDIELYAGSSSPGSKIRGAITGTKFDQYKVGTRDEYLFYKVGIATGEKGLRGNTLFYFDSPEHYEKHMKCIVDTVTKGKWHELNMAERMRRKALEE